MRSSVKYSLLSVLIGLFSAACGQDFETSPHEPGAFGAIEGELRGQHSSDGALKCVNMADALDPLRLSLCMMVIH